MARHKNITLSDVANLAGVSRTTAAKVLLGTGGDHVRIGEATAKQVRAAADTLHYRPNMAARQLAGAKPRTLGLLIDTLNAAVMNDRLAAIEKESSQRGYRLLIGQVHGDNDILSDYLDDFDSRGINAVLCLFDITRGREKRLLPLLGERPIVMHGKPLTNHNYCVKVDTAKAIHLMVEHLIKIGRRRIGLLLENLDDELMMVRYDTYIKAMKATGETPDAKKIWASETKEVVPSMETIRQAVMSLVDSRDVNAIIAANDLWAVRLIQYLKSAGYHVPRDIAVTGYDNLDMATIIDPSLTTIDQQHTLYAQKAVSLLIELNAGRLPDKKTTTIPPKLVIRDSTG